MTSTILADIAGRRAAATNGPPSGARRARDFATSLRSASVTIDGKDFAVLTGKASVVDTPYRMWDAFGPYTETIRSGAFDATLGRTPDVAFLVNHGGLTMARTTNGTLDLSAGPDLDVEARLNPLRQDVKDLVLAVDDGAVDQMSFAFSIERGSWSPDWTEYYIDEVDIDRGDVSAVNYGANPYTSIAARAQQMFDAIDMLEGPALRAAHERLGARLSAGTAVDLDAITATGPSVAFLMAQLAAAE